MDILNEARLVFDEEIDALNQVKTSLDNKFEEFVMKICQCKGKVIITGMGKPGHIGRKMAATFSSLGISSSYLHPAEALHGDLGLLSSDDILIAISWSGESDEIVSLLPEVINRKICLLCITSNVDSTLARYSDIVQVFPKVKEADAWNLAPTSSTTCELVFGDALAVIASKIKGFAKEDFGKNHPAGSLGKKLIYRVSDIMIKDGKYASINFDVKMKDAIIEMSRKASTLVTFTDEEGNLKGIITDGDLRRLLEKGENIYEKKAIEVMTTKPKWIFADDMAINAMKLLTDNRFSAMPVLDSNEKLVGIITLQDILRAGIVIE